MERVAVIANHVAHAPCPQFISLEEAVNLSKGTRVTMIPGIPAVFAESLKNILYVKGIKDGDGLIRVRHPMPGRDKDTGQDRQAFLYKVTSQTSVPTMLHDNERPRNTWLEQLELAEAIGRPGTPRLVPEDLELRSAMFGLCGVIFAEAMVWNKRLLLGGPSGNKYRLSVEMSVKRLEKILAVLDLVDLTLQKQEAIGSRYLVGMDVSAADIYCATMSYMVVPPPPDILPRTKQNNDIWKILSLNPPALKERFTERIALHRNFILKMYCETPAVQGGDPL